MIYDKEGASEEENGEQLTQVELGHSGVAGEESSRNSGDLLEEGGGPSERSGSEASSGERQRSLDKGKAKIEDSWCAGWWLLPRTAGV